MKIVRTVKKWLQNRRYKKAATQRLQEARKNASALADRLNKQAIGMWSPPVYEIWKESNERRVLLLLGDVELVSSISCRLRNSQIRAANNIR